MKALVIVPGEKDGTLELRINHLRGTSETLDTKTGVYVISPAGRLLKFIPIPQDLITNNTFGGADMKTLYVTSSPTLYKVRTAVAGLPR